MNKIPVIIDTDPGIDDTIAIIMAAGSEKIDIKAITTTHGNVGLEGTTKNAMALKEFLGLECPVAKGAAKPMIVSLKDASYVHGENGLAGFELPRPKGTVCEKAAWDVMYDMAKAAGGQMCLLVLGPMTNVALTIMKYPDFKNYIKRIYMMGGSRSYGNHSQYGTGQKARHGREGQHQRRTGLCGQIPDQRHLQNGTGQHGNRLSRPQDIEFFLPEIVLSVMFHHAVFSP